MTKRSMHKFLYFALAFLNTIWLVQGECLKIYESGVNATEQNVIVHKHNALRLLLAKGQISGQPRACNMMRLKYDSKLAKKAQEIANTCTFAHVRVEDSRWNWVGQNLYIMMSTGFSREISWNTAIQGWFDEHKLYRFPNNSDSGTGHYTQMAWATTTYVGCGYTSYEENVRFKYRKLYVCNYGPGGNIRGVAPYKINSNGVCGCANLC